VARVYGFLSMYYEEEVIGYLNTPYGKDSVTRLAELGGRPANRLYGDLPRGLAWHKVRGHFQQELSGEGEWAALHALAIYDDFVDCLAWYQPYFEVNGELYSWAISEKGMNVFVINQDNLREVFEKVRVKVLEHASGLAGLILESDQKVAVTLPPPSV
jgi:hypothetical protein